MKWKVKKFFLYLFSSKKKSTIFLLFFIVLGLSFPIYHTYALSIPGLGGIANAIGEAIGGVIAGFLTVIPAAVMGIASFILQWSIDPKFINIPSYTKGSIVDIGWPVVRDIANMMIVLALVAIGLATALRIEEYQARRTLPRLIFVALLINFTPVILGVIVDATNIIMYFFLSGLMGIEFISRVFSSIHSIVVSDLGNFNFFNPLQMSSFIFKIIIIWIFYIIVAIILLLFAIVFIMRRIAIWMLVIFSPIAFVAWVLPATRGIWNMWWKQFWQWSIIGVSCAFFLYLGDHMIGLAASGNFMGDAPSGLGGWFTRPLITMVEQLMPYFIATLFLLFGFFIALSSSAMGSAGIINFAKKGTQLVGQKAAATGVNVARGTEAGQRIERGTTKWMERMGALAPGTYETRVAKGREEASKTLKALSPEQLQTEVFDRPVRTWDDRQRRAAAMKQLAEGNNLEERHQPYAQDAINQGVPPSTFYKAMPHWEPTAAQIRNRVETMEPGEFRQKVRPHAFETPPPLGALPGTPPTHTPQNLEVFYSMDMRKATELGLRGTRQQKEALRNLTDQMEPQITADIAALRAAGPGTPQWREAEKRENAWTHIQGSPNYD